LDNLEVEKMTIEHIDGVMIIEHLCFSIPWSKEAFIEEIKSNKFARYIVAKKDCNIIGYAGLWKIFDEGHITNIAVHPEFQGIGVGDFLMNNLLVLAKNENIVKLTLEVRAGNTKALKFYRKYGFIEQGIRKGYYSDNKEDAIIMWKEDA